MPDNPRGWPNVVKELRTYGGLLNATDSKLHLPLFGSEGVYTELTDNKSPYSNAFGIDTSSAQIYVDIPWEQQSPFLSHVIGSQKVVGTQLKRIPPLVHPIYEFLRCRHVLNAQGLIWRGSNPAAPQDLGADFPRPYFAEYDRFQCVLNFEPVPFQVKADASITYEYERWCWIRTEPGYESLYVEGGSGDAGGNYIFDDGLATGKIPFAGGRNIPISMPRLLITWYDVPQEFIGTTSAPFFYKNIYAGLQKVNSEEFFGFPAETLLMDNPSIEVRPNPFPETPSSTQTFLCNVTFAFHILNQQAEDIGTAVNPTTRGHNMAIYRFDFKWYPFKRTGSGTDADRKLFKPYDFKKLFQKPT